VRGLSVSVRTGNLVWGENRSADGQDASGGVRKRPQPAFRQVDGANDCNQAEAWLRKAAGDVPEAVHFHAVTVAATGRRNYFRQVAVAARADDQTTGVKIRARTAKTPLVECESARNLPLGRLQS
jgi:hypothetical protein